MFNRSERLAEIAGPGYMPPALSTRLALDGCHLFPPAATRVKQVAMLRTKNEQNQAKWRRFCKKWCFDLDI